MLQPINQSVETLLVEQLESLATYQNAATFNTFNTLIQSQGWHKLSSRVIVVGGTNGKGSSVALLQAIYQAMGYRVATFTSPHLFSVLERFSFNGQYITAKQLQTQLTQLKQTILAARLNYFQILFLVFLNLLKHITVDVVICEVGLGGRLDPVNVLLADCTLITNVAMDHMAQLGETRDEIATEKAGLIHQQGLVVYGEADMPNAIAQACQATESILWRAAHDFHIEAAPSKWQWLLGEQVIYRDLPKPSILLCNAAAVLMVVHGLQHHLSVSDKAIYQGLEHVDCQGRGHLIAGQPSYYFDVAHNEAALQMLATCIAELPCSGRRLAFCGMYPDKLTHTLFRPLRGLFSEWRVVDLGERGEKKSPLSFAACLHSIQVSRYQHATSLADAWLEQLKVLQPDDVLVVFGSFQTVGYGLSQLNSHTILEF